MLRRTFGKRPNTNLEAQELLLSCLYDSERLDVVDVVSDFCFRPVLTLPSKSRKRKLAQKG